MSDFNRDLAQRLARWRAQGLNRELRLVDSPQSPLIRVDGQSLVNFASNDYLGLANDPAIRSAAMRAVEQFGAGSGASRLICGSLAPHQELEAILAEFKGTEAALTFSSGYAAALGTLGALLDKSDIVIIDKLVHACIVDAVRLSGARLRVCAHNDLEDLERLLQWADHQRSVAKSPDRPRILVITESVFSMDGDLAPLKAIVDLKNRYGAWLMVDEAHATGLYGENRCGLAAACGVAERVEIQMGTLSKAIGASGGFVCGSRVLVDFLINHARTFIFSTAPPPAVAAAARAAIRFIMSREGQARCRQLWERAGEVRDGLQKLGRWAERSAIIPIILGDEQTAMRAAAELRAQGIFIPAVRYPAVARGTARLRLTVSAAHTPEQVARLLGALDQVPLPLAEVRC
jgi:8-amino-7-oxononanoate synthase